MKPLIDTVTVLPKPTPKLVSVKSEPLYSTYFSKSLVDEFLARPTGRIILSFSFNLWRPYLKTIYTCIE